MGHLVERCLVEKDCPLCDHPLDTTKVDNMDAFGDDSLNDCIPHRPYHPPIMRLQRPATCIQATDYAKAVALSTFETLFDRKDAPAFTPCGDDI